MITILILERRKQMDIGVLKRWTKRMKNKGEEEEKEKKKK
jgi:hypothetical protein